MRLCVLLLIAGLPTGQFDPHPLDDSQRTRLEAADDNSATIDEAALYALLENASEWSESFAGCVVPDYPSLRTEPERWRGVRCLIEGTLERVMTPALSRDAGRGMQGVVIRIDHSRSDPIDSDYVIVYLADPPKWQWKDEGRGLLWGDPARIAARFYKISRFQTEGGGDDMDQWKQFAVFVGRAVATPSAAKFDRPRPISFLLVVMIVLVAGYMVWRVRNLVVKPRRTSRFEEHLRERRTERDTPNEKTDLPQDPADALDAMAQRHDHSRD